MADYTISETYTLPSQGKIYDKPVDAQVELRSMTTREELRRLNPSSTPLKTLAEIIEECMIKKPAIHVYDMAIGDYEYLLHKLRVISYGPDYKVNLTCPHCEESVEAIANLDDLTVKSFDIAEFEALRTFELPVSKHTITLKISTPHLLEMIENKAKEMKRKVKDAQINFDTYAQLLLMIDMIDEKKVNSTDLEYFIEELPVRDMNRIINKADKLNSYIGIDTTLAISCPHCGEEITTFFRFGPEFFRPTDDE